MSSDHDSPTRIAMFLPDLNGGGAERVFLNLASAFVKRGYTVDMVLARAEGDLKDQLPSGVGLVDLRAGRFLPTRLGLAVGAVVGLARYFRHIRPDALISSLSNTNMVAVAAKLTSQSKTRLIVREAATLLNAKRSLQKSLMGLLYPLADGIVALTEGIGSDLVHNIGIPSERISTIPNPVDLTRLRKLAVLPAPHPWLHDEETPVVLAAGRLTPQKDFGTLVRAFALLRERTKARLIILGKGPEQESLSCLATQLGIRNDVHFGGFDQNPYRWMSRANLFVMSSRWEGFPNALVEALALATPVVSTDCHSGPREILQNGRYGRLVPVANPAALASAIQTSLTTANLSADGATCHLDILGIADRYLEVLLPSEEFSTQLRPS